MSSVTIFRNAINKDKKELLDDIGQSSARPDIYEPLKTILTARCSEDLEKQIADLTASIEHNAKSNNKLALGLLLATIAIAAATITPYLFPLTP